MRGKLPKFQLRHRVRRNIPAYAGKTTSEEGKAYHDQEHPRVCGENGCRNDFGFGFAGTSPRMRGKLVSIAGGAIGQGNIPAYAGKTQPFGECSLSAQEHPRVCGENLVFPHLKRGHIGTSPRMRGKHELAFAVRKTARNIPAYAGKTIHPNEQVETL